MVYEARNLNKSFGADNIINGFNLRVEEGEFVALVGKRGSGMTTLIQMLVGILRPSSGEIFFDGKKVSAFRFNRLRRKSIAYIPTEPILVPNMTVYENLLIALSHRKGNDKTKKKVARDVLKTLGIKDKGRYFPRELTAFEKQKVCIGRAMIKEPDIIFCDEPTDILEGYETEHMLELLEILNSAGYTIVMTTHSKRIAARCHRIVPIAEGVLPGDETDYTPEDALETMIDAREGEASEEEAENEELAEEDISEETAEETSEVTSEVTSEEEAEEEETTVESVDDAEDFDFDNAIAAVALSMLDVNQKEESEKREFDEKDYEGLEEEEPDEDEELGFAAPDYDPDEEFERDEVKRPDDDDDEWNELMTRKTRLNKIKK